MKQFLKIIKKYRGDARLHFLDDRHMDEDHGRGKRSKPSLSVGFQWGNPNTFFGLTFMYHSDNYLFGLYA